MRLALDEARKAGDAGEVPVGALVLDREGQILGFGQNSCIRDCDISAHAEIKALRQAGRAVGNYRLTDCLLVVTLEPCPMCASAIVQARLAGLIFGARDKLAGAVVSATEYLDTPCASGHSVWHLGGVLGEASSALLQAFFAQRR
ncbi:MAG: nucleoside deaminase [Desulfovibrio sp.]|nr:nucleoside deaminase [Desulfovibrio sp.]